MQAKITELTPPKVNAVFNILLGAGMLSQGHPAGLFFIASGATAFGKGDGWQIASGVFAVAGAASGGFASQSGIGLGIADSRVDSNINPAVMAICCIKRVTDDDGPLWFPRGYRFPYSPRYNILTWRVQPQLEDRFPKLKMDRLHDLINRPGGQRIYNEDSGNFSIFRNVPGIGLEKDHLLRITLDDTVSPAQIISVGQELKGTISFRLQEGIYRPAY